MSWDPATLPEVVQAVLDTVGEAVAAYEPTVGEPLGAPDLSWIDMRTPLRKPGDTVSEQGSVAAWVGASRPNSRRPGEVCPTTTLWPIRARWWRCYPTVDDRLKVAVDDRQAASVVIHGVAQAVQRALIAWACGTGYDAVQAIAVGESKPVEPAGGSAGWEWLVTVTT